MLKKTINTNGILCLRQISKIRFNIPIQHGEQQNKKSEFEIGTFVNQLHSRPLMSLNWNLDEH